jgi:probable HAF family extracellular repeat protein
MQRHLLLAVSVATVVACRESPLEPDRPALAAAGHGSYEIIDLGSLAPPDSTSCRGSEAFAINDRGQVLGESKTGRSNSWICPTHAFLWDAGVMTDLGDISGFFPMFLNNRGQVAGRTLGGRGVFWDGATLQDIPTLGGAHNAPSDLGPAGEVVGISTTATGEGHAFLWQDGVIRDLGTLGGTTSGASDINLAGQIVGSSLTASGETHAFLWEAGVMRDLGTLGGAYSAATAISESSAVTGESTDSAGGTHAFLWRDGVMQDLGVLPGFAISSGRRVNSRADVAGLAWNPQFSEQRAFIWSDGVMQDLGHFGWPITTVRALSARGQVAGYSRYCGSVSCIWAFVWEDGVMTNLGALPGHFGSRGNDMNARGDVVGRSVLSTERYHAVLWRRVDQVAVTP